MPSRRALRCVLSIDGMPEALAAMRRELARVLEAEAEAEADPRLARRLREIAAAFECGQVADGRAAAE